MVRYSARSHLPAEHDDQTVAIRQDLLLTSQWSEGEGESEEEKKRRGKGDMREGEGSAREWSDSL
jgi:hypothetical protein